MFADCVNQSSYKNQSMHPAALPGFVSFLADHN
jgi:hypothetical protein